MEYRKQPFKVSQMEQGKWQPLVDLEAGDYF